MQRCVCGQGAGHLQALHLTEEGLVEHWDPKQGVALPVPGPLPASVEGPPTPAPVPGVQAGPDWARWAGTVSSALGTAQDPG